MKVSAVFSKRIAAAHRIEISIIVAPVIIYGGIQMLKARRYSIAQLAAILAFIPLSSICCIPSGSKRS